jgi:hypothetical protein
MKHPVVLDFDHSLGALPGQIVLPLGHWQETLRFGCSLAALGRFRDALDQAMPASHGTVFFGSGDFHHLSWPLIERLSAQGPFQVVVLDNHPDNMRFPFGVHCGSWVRRVAALGCVSHVQVVGITSSDIGRAHAWENYLTPLLRGRLSYWSIGVDVGWAHALGLGRRFRRFADADAMVEAFVAEQRRSPQRTYLSIDKDVFAEEVAHTNWDQGQLHLVHAIALIESLGAGIVGSDINGEVSVHRYRSWWKRRLSALDAQPEIPLAQLAEWQAQQHALNLSLLEVIAPLQE